MEDMQNNQDQYFDISSDAIVFLFTHDEKVYAVLDGNTVDETIKPGEVLYVRLAVNKDAKIEMFDVTDEEEEMVDNNYQLFLETLSKGGNE